MKLRIKNIDSIEDTKLPKLDGYTISLVKVEEHVYEFDIFLNHTLKMVLKVNRDSNYDGRGDMDNYTCIILGGISNNYKWQVVLHRAEFKTSIQFLNAVGEMVSKLSKDMQTDWINSLPSVSAGTHITQSIAF